ncbi:TPA: hypothetical protein ACUU9M_000565 [Yersinia enterocolitica]|uniref:hypothetical protein n=1 Tax=Yersinia enterocolitica TaxID=630 RepID=UPI0005EA287A|nr:hypothetical protein [Yersinia enterocolitica]ELW7402710.1 hypothetical protein [Yersinia enterocolitica]ELZ4049906.1 hypothetical protein [Yersinia enterocolitica]CFQ78167.1 Uncharacterised protein [Yersinia enterocolitica]HDL7460383.1 hypothetical protein [Yersinia enterocolitica]HDM9014499.1 hypothetical protein [Yersinia enterocolitica]
MNFSDTKSSEFPKKTVVNVFEVNQDSSNSLFSSLQQCANFKQDAEFKINSTRTIRIRKINYDGNNCYCHITFYNPKESVSITPITSTALDLLDVDNYDTCHLFMLVNGNRIRAISQISYNWMDKKIKLFLDQLSIYVKPTVVLDQEVIQSIKDEGFSSLHVNATIHSTTFKDDAITGIFRKVPKAGSNGIYGNITFSSKNNPAIAVSVENNTQSWVDDLGSDFYIKTKKGQKITGDKIKLHRMYYTLPYGSKTITSSSAFEILYHFKLNVL